MFADYSIIVSFFHSDDSRPGTSDGRGIPWHKSTFLSINVFNLD